MAAPIKTTRRGRAPIAPKTPPSTDHGQTETLLEEAGLSREIGFVMRMAQLAVFEDLLSRLGDLKLTLSQLTALRLIQARPALSQQRIGDALRIKKTNLVALIDKLESAALVTRAPSETDRRAYALYLTTKGERSLETAMQAVGRHLDTIGGILDADEQERVINALHKLAAQLPQSRRTSGEKR